MGKLQDILKQIDPTVAADAILIKQVSTNAISAWDNDEKHKKATDSWIKNGGGEWVEATEKDVLDFVNSRQPAEEEKGKYDEMKVPELKEELERRNIELVGGEKKADLIVLLEENDKTKE